MLEIALHNPHQHRQFQHDAGPLVLARPAEGEAVWRTVDTEPISALAAVVAIVPEADGVRLQTTGDERRLKLPAQFTIGDTRFEIADSYRSPLQPLEVLVADKSQLPPSNSAVDGPSSATLSRWFTTLGMLHRGTNSPQEFFVQAARCAVEAIGLDGAMVLRLRDGDWEIVASHLPRPALGIHCDRRVLDLLIETPRTMYHAADPLQLGDNPKVTDLIDLLESIDDSVETAAVVAPLVNGNRELIGALYGFRSLRAGNQRRGIRYLEAHLVELVAGAVSDGLARIEHAAEVDRRRAVLEKTLAASAHDDTQRPASETREITLLFADLRDFSQCANVLGVEQASALLGDVMDALTAAVLDHDGMIIDYYGDGLAAMWNAPASQSEHPELACRAALRMIDSLPTVQAKWNEVLGQELRLGIGVHTGVAQVGNAGSRQRWKYGPRGASVHLASRVEAATKAIGMPLVVTGATAARLSNRLFTQRLCCVELPGVNEPIELYGVWPATTKPAVHAALAHYGRALEMYEQGRLADAAQALQVIESNSIQTPAAFLKVHIEQLLSQQSGRRSTDSDEAIAGPVIALDVK